MTWMRPSPAADSARAASPLTEPTSVRMAPSFIAGTAPAATAPKAPTGTQRITQSASRTAASSAGAPPPGPPPYTRTGMEETVPAGRVILARGRGDRRADQAGADDGDAWED